MSDLKLAFNPIQGSESVILNQAYCEGAVYFATDTKRIFMDANNIAKMPMGGNSGVYYGKMILQETPDENQKEFEFSVYDLEINSEDSDSINVPNENDLILNIPDGCFYRVTDISEDKEIIITTEKLTIAGNGGGNNSDGPSLSGVSFNRITEQNVYTLSGIPCVLDFTVTATDTGGELTGNGTYRLTVDGLEKARGTIINNDPNNPNDFNSIDVSPYLHDDTNAVKIYASMDVGGISNVEVSKSWSINVVSVELKWTPSFTQPHFINEEFNLEWEIVGGAGVEKITHITIDGQDYTDNTTTTGLQSKKFNPVTMGLTHGIHRFELYVEAFIGGASKPTPSITKNLIFVDPTNENYIINYDYYGNSMMQYDTIRIPVTVYGIKNSGVTIHFNENESEKGYKDQLTNGETYTFSYTALGAGPQVLSFVCGQTEESFLINVESIGFTIEEEKDYAFKFKASEFSDNGGIQNWISNGTTAQFNNFDWINGGLKIENDEFDNPRQYVCVKAGSTMEINYNVFGAGAKGKGKCLKIIFKATKCKDYDARILSCHDGQRGFIMNAQNAIFNSMLTQWDIPYCEDSYIELELDITNSDDKNPKRKYIRTWIDGVPAGLRLYSGQDEFSTQEGNTLIIGSNDCDVQIYLIKLYERTLTDEQHLNNFIADAPNSAEIISRFTRNNILSGGEISPTLLAEANPNCLVHSYTIERMTTSKEDPVEGCSYVQYHGRGDKPSLQANNVTIKVQGTSSAAYGLAAYNLDSDFTEGFLDEDLNPISGWSMSDSAIPVNYFCTKVNVASVENANNVLNQEWYNRYQPYQSVLRGRRRADGKSYRDCMEFTPGVLFIKDLNPKTDKPSGYENNVFKENANYCSTTNEKGTLLTSAWPKMYSICNMGNSKDNIEVFHDADNPKECCIENADNQQPGQWMVVPQGIYTDKDTGNIVYVNITSIEKDAKTLCPDGEIRDNFSMWVDGMDKIYKFRYPKKAISKFKNKNTDEETKAQIETMIRGWFDFVLWMSQNNPSEKYTTKRFEDHWERVTYKTEDAFEAEPLEKHLLINGQYIKADSYAADEDTAYYIWLTEEESFIRYPGGIFTLENENEEDKAKHLGRHIEVTDRTQYNNQITYYVITDHLYGASNEPLSSSVTFEAKTFDGYKVKDPELAKYQEGYTPILEEFTESAYAGTYYYDTTDYRIAKMLQTCEEHLCMESVVFHYLFIERHCMIDNVAKNTFWTTEDGSVWNLTKNYDNDTSDGNDNQGKLTLTYGLEPGDTDAHEVSVFNAGNSVWLNFIRKLYATCKKVYTELDKSSASKPSAWSAEAYLKIFKDWQSSIPERCWIEDFYRKYIRPYEIYEKTMYIEMGEGGKKTYQRKQFETYQESYISSKYFGNVCGENHFILRLNGNQFDDDFVIPITLYADCYIQGAFGSDGMKNPNISIRGKRNQTIELRSPIKNATDATAYLYPSNLYQSLGNENAGLNKFLLKQYEVSNANKLRTLALGVFNQGENASLESISLGSCENLENLYVAEFLNCTNNTLNLNNSSSIKRIDARNSGFPAIEIPAGAPLESLQAHTPISIKLSDLNKLNQLTFSEQEGMINSLTKIDIDNIDNSRINTKTDIIDKAPNLNSAKVLNVQWIINNSEELDLDAKEIDILEKLQDTTFRNEKEEIVPRQNTLSGVLTIKQSACNDGTASIEIYNNYVNENVYPKLDIIFEGNAKLPKVIVLNGNKEIYWSRRITNGKTITDDFLSSGPSGAFNFKTATTQQSTIGETYEFTGQWKIYLKNKNTGEFEAQKDMVKLEALTEYTEKITEDIIFEPQFLPKTRTYELKFYTYNEATGKVDKLIKTVEAAPYKTDVSSYYPEIIPYKPDDSNYRIKETNHFIGYGLSPEALTPVKDDSTVSKDQSFYAIFEKVSDVTKIVHPEWFDFTEYSYDESGPYEVARFIPTNYLPQGKRLNAVQGYSISIKPGLILKGKVTIPATYNGLPIVKISDSFAIAAKNQEITHIFFEKDNQIYEIGTSAFQNNKKLMYFDFSATKVRQIRGWAFHNCQKLNPACFTFNNAQLFYVGQAGFSGCFDRNGTGTVLKIPGSICVLCQFAFAFLNVPIGSSMEIGSATDSFNFLIDINLGHDQESLSTINFFQQNTDGTFKLITLFSPYASLQDKVKDKDGNEIEGVQVAHIFGVPPKSGLELKQC